ncbi:MAG: hypothetical protein KZQ84_00515 [Candidatus Thiodiazotropha sp. (ex Lucinoma borealis)]|nr:hypothetical protein [Candidatus Thiodiazotropha sp. (ex Lucinoma borealis)]
MGKKYYIVAIVLLATLSWWIGEDSIAEKKPADNIYHPSLFLKFYENELASLSGDDPVNALRSIYKMSANQSADIGMFLTNLWDMEKISNVEINYSLFSYEPLKLMLAQSLLQRSMRTTEILDYVYSTVNMEDVDNQYPTIQALRLSNDNRSLEYLRDYSIKGNRTTAEYAIPGIVHWAYYGSNKEKASSELDMVRRHTSHHDIINKYVDGYEKDKRSKEQGS